jgi:2-polyprenyl-3-methyl-5-hydroxy-6-metoxy-1,4-benzoquinol methylase
MEVDNKGESEWELRYQSGHTGWDRGTVSPALLCWVKVGQLAPGRVLVPGCGRGYEVIELASRGFEVTAIDIAPSAIEALTHHLSRASVSAKILQADLLHWSPDATFDAVYEQTCLCALEPATWSDYVQRLHQWVKPGGHVFALFMQTGQEGGPPYHCAIEDMRRLFSDHQWAWLDGYPQKVSHPTGFYELSHVLRRL